MKTHPFLLFACLAYIILALLWVAPSDRGFVAGLPSDSKDVAIARSVIVLAQSLGLSVLAEGIEQPEQAEFLERNQCFLGQGYLFGRPQPAEELFRTATVLPEKILTD